MAKVLVLDTETTGLPKKSGRHYVKPTLETIHTAYAGARMLSLAYSVIDSASNILVEKSFLVRDYGIIIPPKIEELTGITKNMIQCETSTTLLRDILTELSEDAKNIDLIVAHNVQFDLNIVASELYHEGMTKEAERWMKCETYCTCKNSGYRKLKDCIEHDLQEEAISLHSALHDMRYCRKLYLHQRSSDNSGMRMTFGKYKGLLVKDVAARYPDYAAWVIESLSSKYPAVCDALKNSLASKPSSGNSSSRIKALKQTFQGKVLEKFSIYPKEVESTLFYMEEEAENCIQKMRKLSPIFCGCFFDYLCRYCLTNDSSQFSDNRLEQVKKMIFFDGKEYFPRGPFDDCEILSCTRNMEMPDISCSTVVPSTLQEKHHPFLRQFFSMLHDPPIEFTLPQRVLLWSICHSITFYNFDDISYLNDLILLVRDLDIESFKIPLTSLISGNIDCNPIIGNSLVPADCDLIIDDRHIIEIKVANNRAEYYLDQLVGYAALAHARGKQIDKVSVLNFLDQKYTTFDVSGVAQDSWKSFATFLSW